MTIERKDGLKQPVMIVVLVNRYKARYRQSNLVILHPTVQSGFVFHIDASAQRQEPTFLFTEVPCEKI